MNSYHYNPELFAEKITKSSGCWVWTGAITTGGYGQVSVKTPTGRRPMPAHRIAYESAIGPIPEGKILDHICHNRACVRIDHLRVVTHKQNAEHKVGSNRNSKSGILGVIWRPRQNRWLAVVGHNGNRIHIGYFHTSDEADNAVKQKRNELFTHNDADRMVGK